MVRTTLAFRGVVVHKHVVLHRAPFVECETMTPVLLTTRPDVLHWDVRRAGGVLDRLGAYYLKTRFAEHIAEFLSGEHIPPETLRRLCPVAGEPVVKDTNQASEAIQT